MRNNYWDKTISKITNIYQWRKYWEFKIGKNK